MESVADLSAALLLVIAGFEVGTASAFFYIVLGLPLRVYDAMGALNDHTPRSTGVALTIGTVTATLASALGLRAALPTLAFVCAIFIGGVFTGLIAAGLSEVLSVLPHTMFAFHIEDDARPLMLAVCIGKTVGALMAILLSI